MTIKELRKAKGLSIVDIALATHIHKTRLVELENGREASLDELDAISVACKMPKRFLTDHMIERRYQ